MTGAATGDCATEPSPAVLAQAAAWYACLRDGQAGAEERAAWQAWLAAAGEHAAAWHQVEQISRALAPVRSMPDRRRAADRLTTANDRLLTRRRILASVVLVAGAGLSGWFAGRGGAGGGSGLVGLADRQSWLPDRLMAWAADHGTATGEQRALVLADGTRLWLNTASAIDLQFSEQERRIRLLAGEIFVETAEELDRPFVVETTQGRMRALGTRFNVRRDGDATRLSVFEGAVEIRTAAARGTAILARGSQVGFGAGHIEAVTAVELAQEAWIRGILVADSLSLREVVRELRRYRKGYLDVADDVADLTVYGTFPLHDTDRVLRMLASALPLRIETPLPWWTRIDRQP